MAASLARASDPDPGRSGDCPAPAERARRRPSSSRGGGLGWSGAARRPGFRGGRTARQGRRNRRGHPEPTTSRRWRPPPIPVPRSGSVGERQAATARSASRCGAYLRIDLYQLRLAPRCACLGTRRGCAHWRRTTANDEPARAPSAASTRAKVVGEGPGPVASRALLATLRSGGSASWADVPAAADVTALAGLLLWLASGREDSVGAETSD